MAVAVVPITSIVVGKDCVPVISVAAVDTIVVDAVPVPAVAVIVTNVELVV